MPFDLRRIADAQKKALALVEDAERRRVLEQFIESSGPLVEAAARDALQYLADEINAQIAPGARLRLVQEGTGSYRRWYPSARTHRDDGRWALTVTASLKSSFECPLTLKRRRLKRPRRLELP